MISSVTGKTGGTFNCKATASLASNVVPMAMAARMMTGGGMLNPSMMQALLGGQGGGAGVAGMDPMMSGMSMFLKGSNPSTGPAGIMSMFGSPAAASQKPGAADTAIAAALDQEAKTIIAQLKPAAQ